MIRPHLGTDARMDRCTQASSGLQLLEKGNALPSFPSPAGAQLSRFVSRGGTPSEQVCSPSLPPPPHLSSCVARRGTPSSSMMGLRSSGSPSAAAQMAFKGRTGVR